MVSSARLTRWPRRAARAAGRDPQVRVAEQLTADDPAGRQVPGQRGLVGRRPVGCHGADVDAQAARAEAGQDPRRVHARQPPAELAAHRGGRDHDIGAERIRGGRPSSSRFPEVIPWASSAEHMAGSQATIASRLTWRATQAAAWVRTAAASPSTAAGRASASTGPCLTGPGVTAPRGAVPVHPPRPRPSTARDATPPRHRRPRPPAPRPPPWWPACGTARLVWRRCAVAWAGRGTGPWRAASSSSTAARAIASAVSGGARSARPDPWAAPCRRRPSRRPARAAGPRPGNWLPAGEQRVQVVHGLGWPPTSRQARSISGSPSCLRAGSDFASSKAPNGTAGRHGGIRGAAGPPRAGMGAGR